MPALPRLKMFGKRLAFERKKLVCLQPVKAEGQLRKAVEKV
jgi:hypothetical protein